MLETLLFRWHNHLDPSINKKQWSDLEEMQFIQAHQALGNKWGEISKIIRGRTDNAIKNHFYSSLRKNLSRISKEVVTLDQKLSQQTRDQSIYLINYLKNLLRRQIEAETHILSNPASRSFNFSQYEESKQGGLNLHQQIGPAIVGQNDKYLISKLRSYCITVEKIDAYLHKLGQESSNFSLPQNVAELQLIQNVAQQRATVNPNLLLGDNLTSNDISNYLEILNHQNAY